MADLTDAGRLINSYATVLVSALIIVTAISSPAIGQVINNQAAPANANSQILPVDANDQTLPVDANETPVVTQIVPEPEVVENQQGAAPRSNLPASAVEPGTRPVSEDDPFAPTGIQIGSLRLTTIVEQGIGYTTNRQNAAMGDGGAVSQTELDMTLRSEWSRHDLEIVGAGKYQTNFDSQIDPDPGAQIDARLRLDLIDGYEATIGGNYEFETESASSVNLSQTAINEPGVHTFGAFADLQRTGHRFGFTLRAGIERQLYENAKLSGGGVQSQADRNFTSHTVQARLSYDIDLAFSPFVQASYTNNTYDLMVDRNGQRRDSTSYELRGGIAVNLSEKLNGEISAGYLNRDYVDPGLAALSGFVIDANMNWSPQRDTNIGLTLASNVDGSTSADDSGAITYEGALMLTRRIRDNLQVSANLGISRTDYPGLGRLDTTYNAGLGFEHWLNRAMSITGDLSHEKFDSSDMGSSYDATTAILGIKFQR
ncbi:MAG: outer membrane beta-barrel protein [Hyphomicrobiales bacterium]|nr:outer membrane beta-barrel protein [Hyphomicrobiales bacterium]